MRMSGWLAAARSRLIASSRLSASSPAASAASAASFVVLAGEDREHAVADEFQHLAAALGDRRRHRVEIIVEQRDELARRQPVRQRREAAQIGRHQRRAHRLALAPLDLAVEDVLADGAAEIGVEHVAGQAPQRLRLDHHAQRRQHAPDRRQVAIGKAVRVVGREGDDMMTAAQHRERAGEVARRARLAQRHEQRERRDIVAVEPIAHRLAMLHRRPHRAVEIIRRLADAMGDLDLLDHVAVVPPAQAEPQKLRMKRADRQRRAGQAHALADQPPGELVEKLGDRRWRRGPRSAPSRPNCHRRSAGRGCGRSRRRYRARSAAAAGRW